MNSTGSFLETAFGGDAAKIERAFVAAGVEAHNRSLEAKVASQLKTNHAYGGTCWLALAEEIVDRVGSELEGAHVVPVPGAPYSILIKDGYAILPVKVIEGGTRDGRMRASVSDLRARLASVNKPGVEQQSLFDADQDNSDAAGEVVVAALEELERERASVEAIASVLVVAAFQCGPSTGLRAVQVGIATFDADGFIDFTDSQKLSLLDTPIPFPTVASVKGDTFDTAPRPMPRLELQEEPALGGEVSEQK
ncbi:hypothetical protein ASF05_00565 [Aeromicrobium sp. Leaf245]|nr:hypothetical protein ASF05_00565 [Aeromicrobium sp. Leaf245]KQP83530.1 hypothetical protein ASF35_00575 [Aeromicrobium sp. Leaf291]